MIPVPSQPTLRAIIYLRELTTEAYECCLALCARKGYRVLGVLLDPDGARYDQLQQSAMWGEADVIVMCSRDDLPPNRIPRVDTDTSAWLRDQVSPLHRRPRHRRRG